MDDFRRAIEIMMHLSVFPDVLDAGRIAMQQEDRRIEREIEARFGCLVCGQKHEARPIKECRKAMADKTDKYRAATAQLIKEFGMQNERMVFCGRGYGKKSLQPKIVLGVDAGSPENSISKLRGVKAFLDEMKAARKREKKHAKKCIAWERRKRLAMRQGKRLDAKRRKQAKKGLNKRHGKPTRLCRNARLNVHRERYQKWAQGNKVTITLDKHEARGLGVDGAVSVTVDLRECFVNRTHDGLEVGDVLGKRSLAINSTFGHTSIYCNGREVVHFDMFQGPPRKYQRNGWMLLRHLEKISARRPKARWTVTMCHDAKEFSATWERKRPKHWEITRIDDRSDYPIADRMIP